MTHNFTPDARPMLCSIAEGRPAPSCAPAIPGRSAPQVESQRWCRIQINLVGPEPSPHGRLVGTHKPLEQLKGHGKLPGRPARHLAPDGPARLDRLDIAGQREIPSDEALRIAKALGH